MLEGGADKLGSAFAPAKINLALHVVGQRADGYHLLDSLVAFAGIGDTVTAAVPVAHAAMLAIDGPFGAGLEPTDDNLVAKARRALEALGVDVPPCRLMLTKRLPIASGIGGGSADAAATLRLLNAIATRPATEAQIDAIAAELGADVPMCLRSRPLRARGIGADIDPVAGMPTLPVVLANPRVAVATPAVFKALRHRSNSPMIEPLPRWTNAADVSAWLVANTRNDLEEPAIAVAPAIRTVLDAVSATRDNALSRMSGSGATVFGLYPDPATARLAAQALAAAHPDWWVVATETGTSPRPG